MRRLRARMVDDRQEQVLWACHLAPVSCQLAGSVLDLHHQVAAATTVNRWPIGTAGTAGCLRPGAGHRISLTNADAGRCRPH
jgi:hypothetical protein